MINVNVAQSDRCNGTYSAYLSFPYDESIISVVRGLSDRAWHSETKTWEIPYASLADVLVQFVDHDIQLQGDIYSAEHEHDEREVDLTFNFKTTPYSYQLDGFKYGLTHANWLLGDEQGLGKTKQVIDIACAKKEREGYQHVLIICGVNGLKWNWLNEIHTHSDEDGYIIGQKVRKNGKLYVGSNEDKLACLNDIDSLPYFIITNVESLRYGVKTGNMIKKRVKGVIREIPEVVYPITDRLVELCNEGKINLIAFDEMHKCKNTQSQQGEQTLRLNAQNNIAMTGTPLMNKPMDLYAILKWLGYEKHSLYQFTQYYCVYGGFERHEVVGYKHLDELEAHLNSVMLRRRKEDVLDLPEKTFIDEYVEMTPKQTRLYNEVLNALRMDIDKIKLSHNPLTQIIRLRQVTGYTGIVSSEVTESAKLDRLCELAEDIVANGKKFVVFSNWTQMTDVIRERLSMYRPAVVTGETKDEDRSAAMNMFQNDATCKCIIGTVGALGTGFTLTAGTNVIFVDEPWTQAMKDQAIDRCHRIGTTENVTVYTLLTKDTIDERVNDIVKQKGMLADTIVDGKPVDTDALIDYLLS